MLSLEDYATKLSRGWVGNVDMCGHVKIDIVPVYQMTGLLLSPAGHLTPPVDFVTFFVTDGQTDRRTDRQTDRQTDGQTDELKVFWAFYSILKN